MLRSTMVQNFGKEKNGWQRCRFDSCTCNYAHLIDTVPPVVVLFFLFRELHELTRKLLLTGILVFVSETAPRTATAILICATAVASLHYYRPHKNTIVFKVAQASFLLSTFKYVATLLIQHAIVLDDLDQVQGVKGAVTRKTQIGYVLIVLDVLFFLGSWSAGVLAIVMLRRSIVQAAIKHEHKIALVKEKRASMAAVHPQRRDKQPDKSMDQVKRKEILDRMQGFRTGPTLNSNGTAFINKVLTVDKAHAAQNKHAVSTARRHVKIKNKKKHALIRLENRLLSRKKLKMIGNSIRLGGSGVGSAVHVGDQNIVEEYGTSNPPSLNGNGNNARGALKTTDIKSFILKAINSPDKLKRILTKLTNNTDTDQVSKAIFFKLVKSCSKRVYETVPTDTTTTACWNMIASTETETTITVTTITTWLFGGTNTTVSR